MVAAKTYKLSAFVFVSVPCCSQLDLSSQLPNHRECLIFHHRKLSAPLSLSSPFPAAPSCWADRERFISQLKFLPVLSQQVIRPPELSLSSQPTMDSVSLNEALIAAVQKRQPLYDKSDDNYPNSIQQWIIQTDRRKHKLFRLFWF